MLQYINVCCNIFTSAAIYLLLLQYIYVCCNIFTSAAIYLCRLVLLWRKAERMLQYIYVCWFCCKGKLNKYCKMLFFTSADFVMKESWTNAAIYLRLLVLLWRKAKQMLQNIIIYVCWFCYEGKLNKCCKIYLLCLFL